ncbi:MULTISPECIES: hypothetical protein [unclassified Lysinibacillus]|uniref:hypothetical protein n=1 Tax=unclassified Lysinibacillus TaxID=2636778 RepID=UPI0038189073
MAIRSGMFNSVNGDRKVDAAFFSLFFSTFIGDGVFPNPSTGLQIVEGQGMQTIVKPGKGWIQGRFVINDSNHIFKHDIADGVLKRIDRVVMRLNHLTRQIEIVLKKGSQASSPTAPTIQRDAEAYELVLADVLINAGTTQITQGNITDQRLNKSLCGIVHGVVDQVDTTTIFNQYQSWFNQYSHVKALEFEEWQARVTSELEAWIQAEELDFTVWKAEQELTFSQWSEGRKDAFDVWFATIRGILDEEAAGNIMNVINDHKDSPVPHKYYDEELAQPMLYGLKRNADLNTPAFVYGATEAGHHDVINLPNYEQVEDVKTVLTAAMEATGGKVADVNGKMYKAVMLEGFEIRHGFGADYWDPIIQSYKTKYPSLDAEFSALGIMANLKIKLWDDLYMVTNGNNIIVFIDMVKFETVSATKIVASGLFNGFVKTENGWFVDAKYLYVRGQYGTTTKLVVFDRATLNYVRVIAQGVDTTGSFTNTETLIGEMVCLDSNFFVIMATNNLIWVYKIHYDSSGVPTQWVYDYSRAFGNGNQSAVALLSEGIYLYVIVRNDSSSNYVEQWNYNPLSKTLTRNYNVYNSAATSGNSRWNYKYKIDGIRYVVMTLGNSSIQMYNLTTGKLHQLIQSAPFLNEFPTFDYKNGDRLIIQPQTVVGYDISGNTYNVVYEMHLLDNMWISKPFYMLGIKPPGGTTASNQVSFGSYGYYKDRQLYARFANEYARKIETVNLIAAYKEVTE